MKKKEVLLLFFFSENSCDEVDYDEGIGSARGSYTLLVDQSGIIPITVGSGTLTSIEMTRKETLVNEHLQDVEIVTLVKTRETKLFYFLTVFTERYVKSGSL